jgi:hypothetical protein
MENLYSKGMVVTLVERKRHLSINLMYRPVKGKKSMDDLTDIDKGMIAQALDGDGGLSAGENGQEENEASEGMKLKQQNARRSMWNKSRRVKTNV